ncbi:cell wall surface anchor protein [Enterococcus florum]|uniref:Cell wall surface anchor protein n=1 Tax=Enterococcus florum TaxID=2480627 RepID=A0A4P5PNJ8_9ENTE|nr:pilin N-terminal domain-containing protein [Enterococcus florum]GCF94743.1 cell wall surface anchor protein [Enterococcus florum]
MNVRKQKLTIVFAVFSLLLPLLFSIGALQTAHAAEGEQTVTIHKRKYTTMPNEIQNTGDEMDFGGEPLGGATFTAYDVTSTYWTAYDAASGTHAQKEAAGIAAAKAADTTSMTGTVFPATDAAEGIAEKALPVSSGGQNAIYLFKETGIPSGVVQSKSIPFVIGLPSHKADGSLREKVHVYPKNEVKTNTLSFIKYGIEADGTKAVLPDATFILKSVANGKYYNSTSNQFDAEQADAARLTSDGSGIVSVPGLALAPGDYAFYEVDSSVSTAAEQQGTTEIFHYKTNPVVVAHVSTDMAVTYDYYDQSLVKKTGQENAEAYNYKVPIPEKEADDQEVENGQIVTFTIKHPIPDDVAQYTLYQLVDDYDSRLELVSTEQELKDSIQIDGQKETLTSTYASGTNQFTLAFVPSELTAHAGKILTFKVKMRVKTGTDLTLIDNEITFDNNFYDRKDKEEIISYGKLFKKIDSNSRKTLEGAEFVIKDGANFLQLLDGDGQRVAKVTGYASGYEVKWVSSEAEATVLASDKDGKFGVYGLGSKAKDHYTLVETKAPEGYALLGDILFTADNGTAILDVENKTRGFLPSTGGVGTTVLLMVGLAGFAGAMLYFKKTRVTR